MKHLILKSPSFQYIEKSFREWLQLMGYAERTVYNLPNHVREFLHYLEQQGYKQIQDVSTDLVRDYYKYLKHRNNKRDGFGALSNGALNKQLQALYKFMEYLRQSGRIILAPLEIRREEKNSKAIDVLSIAEIKTLFSSTEIEAINRKQAALLSRDKAMLVVFYSCGLRRTEAVSLSVDDINWERRILHVKKGKNYKERFVPLNKTNLKVLEDYTYNHRTYFANARVLNAFFISLRGKCMDGQSLAIRLKLIQQKTDDFHLKQKHLTPHTLRHSIATHLLSAGMELTKIQRFLGHNSLESTQIYTHLVQQENENT